MKKNLMILLIGIFLTGCSSNENKVDINKLMTENEYIIIDVRTDEEYKESHIVDAINIPYDEITEKTELDKEKIIFVYCKSGNRSSIAYKTLTDLGYTVYDLGAFSDIDLEKE